MASVVSRALMQVGIGAALGAVGALFLSDEAKTEGPAMFVAVAALLCVVGVLACFAPLRRALRIQPTDALRES